MANTRYGAWLANQPGGSLEDPDLLASANELIRRAELQSAGLDPERVGLLSGQTPLATSSTTASPSVPLAGPAGRANPFGQPVGGGEELAPVMRGLARMWLGSALKPEGAAAAGLAEPPSMPSPDRIVRTSAPRGLPANTPIPNTVGTPEFAAIQQDLDRKLAENQRQATLDSIKFSIGGGPMKSYLREGVSAADAASMGPGMIEEAPGFRKQTTPRPDLTGGGVSILTPTEDQAAQLRQDDLVRDIRTKALEAKLMEASMTPQQKAALAQKATMTPIEMAIQGQGFKEYRESQRLAMAQRAQIEASNLPQAQKDAKLKELRDRTDEELRRALALMNVPGSRGTPSKAFTDTEF